MTQLPLTATTANGSYGIGAVINLTIGFSEDVIVDTTNGTPTLQLQTGDIDRYATYASGSGTATLTFQYTVQEGDTSTDLDQLSSTALTLNGGSINDAAGNAAILTLAAPGDTGSLAANADLVIDTTRPTGSQGSFAAAPAFAQEEGNTPFGIAAVGDSASPAFADIDGDGDLDLFIGDGYGDKLLFFRNTGSASAPAYTQEGEDTPFEITGVGSYASPALADIDGDGDLDLFISNSDGKTLFFRNTGSASAPAYTQEGEDTPFGIPAVGNYASPSLIDADGDGDLDLFIGNVYGNTFFFRNTAAPGSTTPAYTQEEGNTPFGIPGVGYSASPAFADIDSDGDLDLFIGNSDGKSLFFRNTGSASAPAYTQEGGTTPYGDQGLGSATSPTFADVDSDGDLDLFIGIEAGNTLFFRNTAATPVAPVNATTANGSYGIGAVINLTIGFSEHVIVDTTNGTPTLQLQTGDIDRYAVYASGSGSSTLTFQYTVQEGDTSTDLDQLSSTALTLNGGSINDAAGNAAILTLAAPGDTGSLAANADLVIDTTRPTGSQASFAVAPAFAQEGEDTPFGIADVGNNASPAFADIDGDGDLDLFIGNSRGETLFFRNTAAPGSTTPAYTQEEGNIPFGIADVGNNASPAFADIDGDGDLDLFIGNKNGNTRFFRNTAAPGSTTPAYTQEEGNIPFGIADVGSRASPAFADIDGDGDLDLFIGNSDGKTLFFRNTANTGATTPAYTQEGGDTPFGIANVGSLASPAFADIDGDGDLDLFIGNVYGNTLFFRNTAAVGAATPAYTQEGEDTPFGIPDVGGSSSPALADIDGDGDLDLFIGKNDGNTFFFRNTAATPVAPVNATTTNGIYGIGAVINLTIGFSEDVIVDTTNGTPTLQLQTGDIDRYATYASGSGSTLTFQYTVQEGDTSTDLDQLSSTALTLNGGSINDAAGNAAILTLAAPGDTGSLAANADLVIDTTRPTGSQASFAAARAFVQEEGANEEPNPFGIADVGSLASSAFADIDGDGDLDLFIGNISGKTLFFRNTGSASAPAYTQEGGDTPFGITDVGDWASPFFADIDADGDLDLFIGNKTSNTLFFRNTGSASAPAYTQEEGTTPFGEDDPLRFGLSAFVDTDGDGDLDLFIGDYTEDGGNIRFFRNTAAPGSTTPAYTQEGEDTPFGEDNPLREDNPIGISTFADIDGDGDLDLFIGNISGDTLFFRNTPATPVAPVTASTANGSYGIGAVINLTIGFSEDVIVDITNGTPTLQLQTGDIDRYATYASGSGTATLTFQYTVQEGDTSTDLDQLSSTALTLNGGSINDAAGNAAILTLAAPAETGSLAANADLVIDTTRPTGSQASFVQEEGNTPFGIADVYYYASPAFADIDGDGDLDLFIGNVYGNTLFFRNTAAVGAATPAYTQEGEDTPFGIANVGEDASPAFADIDGDGDLDLFIGDYDGNTFFFRNTAAPGSTTPAYTQEGEDTPFGIANVGEDASPAFADIDGDGDLDLFIGNNDGNTRFFRNTGSASAPAYTQEEGANGEPNPFGIPAVGSNANPAFADIDGDGDLDLFIGNNDGNTFFFRNTGSASAPAYTQEGEDTPFGITNVGYYASPAFADIDGDGDLDLFIGDYDGNTLFFRNIAAPPVAPVNATTADGSYGIGTVINLTIGFSEDVIVDTTNGTPTLQLQTGDIDRYATYASGSGTATLTFQYTVQEGDTSTDLDQLSSTALTLNGGSINDAAGNAAILTLAAPGDTGSLAANADLVIDTTRPTGSQGSFAAAPAFAKEEGANEEPNPFGIPDVGYYASPALIDVDSDGDLDLFIGNSYGNTLFFRNTATTGATTPAYTQEGEDTPFGIANVGEDALASPAFADIDGDGDLDLFIGNVYGNTLFFRNTAAVGAATPAYTQEGEDTPFGIANVGEDASPAFADIDGDGDLDLFIGDYDGNTFFFRNTAAPGSTTPAYTQEEGNTPFGIPDVGEDANPAFADIDGDGDLDLFIGNNDGNTLFFRNTATPGATTPAYTQEEGNTPFGIAGVAYTASPAFADIDGDGDLDLFISNSSGKTRFFRNTAATPVAPVNATTTNGSYGVGAVINLTIGFSEDVIVDTTNGTPTLQLQTGDIDRYATYASGSGTATLTFQYTVQEGDTSTDLDQLSSTALTLNGGSINDAAGNAAILTLAAPGDTGSLAANADLVIDTATGINSARYNVASGVLTVTGSNLPAYTGSSNDIDVSKLTITGESGGTYTLSSSDVELTSATEFTVTLNSSDRTNLDSILNKNGASSSQGTTYNIAAANLWAPGADNSTDIADLTGNAITVSNIPNRAPTGTVSISGTATQGETLTAANTLVDLDGLGSIGYQWNRAGVAISGATSSTYLLGRADVGSTITVTANYTDGEEKAESVTSISATPMVASRNYIYHLSSDAIDGIANSGIPITNKRGQTFSDTSSSRWDVVKAVQDGSNQWKVLLIGINSHDGKWYCWNVDETGVITSGSGWKNTADAINAGWDSTFGNSLSPNIATSLSVLDVNANGIVDDITNYHLTNGSNSVRLHSTDLQSYSHESSANWDVSKAVEINGAWKVLVKGANSMDGMWSVWDAGVSGTVTQASTWMSTADSLKEGWEQIFGDVIQVDNIIGPVENRNDSNSDGLMDDMVIYHLDNGENGDGMAIHNSRGNTYSDASTSRWDAVLAVEDNNNDWKVLLQGTGSYDGKWYYWNVDDTGLITSGSGWKSYQGAIDDGWQSFFGNDLKGFNNNQLIIEDPNVITS